MIAILTRRTLVGVTTLSACWMLAGTIRAAAAPNGLNQIPIAKVYGDGGAAFSVAQSDFGGTSSTVATTQFGLFNIAELGVDYQATPGYQAAFLGNAKLLAFHRPGSIPDIAVGLQNIAQGRRAVPYAVATSQPKALGISLGVIRPTANGYEGMAGLSYNVTPNFQLVSDTIGGWSNFTTIGVIANLTSAVTLNVAYAAPNSAEAGPQGYVFNLTYVFHLPHGGLSHGKDLSGTLPGAAPSPTSGNGAAPKKT